MKERYIALMEKALSAYSDEHIVDYFERVKKEGEVIYCKTNPAESKKSDGKKNLDYIVKVCLVCPYILDAPDAADDSDEPDEK